METEQATQLPHLYRISAVSYLNTKPLLFGLENNPIYKKIKITQDIPSLCAQKLLNDEVDIGLVPIAIIPQLKQPRIVSPYCIGADGEVKTVCLFSAVPMEQINTIYLDYQSRTSVLLVQLLMKEYWKKEVNFLPATEGFENVIKEDIAAVIIGDRAITAAKKYPYVYDLSLAWKQHTGLPFVFAAWVSNKEIDADFLDEFNAAIKNGLEHRLQLVDQFTSYNSDSFSIQEYWTKNIQYEITPDKKQAFELFIQKLNPKTQYIYCY